MVKARCFRCGFAFQFTEQFLANALAAQGAGGHPEHYMAECPHCRRVNKIPLKRVRLPEAQAEGEKHEAG